MSAAAVRGLRARSPQGWMGLDGRTTSPHTLTQRACGDAKPACSDSGKAIRSRRTVAAAVRKRFRLDRAAPPCQRIASSKLRARPSWSRRLWPYLDCDWDALRAQGAPGFRRTKGSNAPGCSNGSSAAPRVMASAVVASAFRSSTPSSSHTRRPPILRRALRNAASASGSSSASPEVASPLEAAGRPSAWSA